MTRMASRDTLSIWKNRVISKPQLDDLRIQAKEKSKNKIIQKSHELFFHIYYTVNIAQQKFRIQVDPTGPAHIQISV